MSPATGPDILSRTHAQLWRDRLVILLAINSGATDAIGFLALGGAFSSVMTGNMVLFGLSLAKVDQSLTRLTTTSILGFVLGCAIGARLAGVPQPDDGTWPIQVSRTLALQTLLCFGGAIGWWLSGPHRTHSAQMLLLSASALSLGMQSSTVQRLGEGGLSTTYLTGTLTGLVAKLATGGSLNSIRRSMFLLLGLIGGAVIGAVLVRRAPDCVPLAELVPLVVTLLASIHLFHSRRRDTQTTAQSWMQ